jgi:hypothetical protein
MFEVAAGFCRHPAHCSAWTWSVLQGDVDAAAGQVETQPDLRRRGLDRDAVLILRIDGISAAGDRRGDELQRAFESSSVATICRTRSLESCLSARPFLISCE